MNQDPDIARTLAAIAQTLDHRVEIYRVILALDRTVIGRIYRGSLPQGEHRVIHPSHTR
jgi:hypothetical protein